MPLNLMDKRCWRWGYRPLFADYFLRTFTER